MCLKVNINELKIQSLSYDHNKKSKYKTELAHVLVNIHIEKVNINV